MVYFIQYRYIIFLFLIFFVPSPLFSSQHNLMGLQQIAHLHLKYRFGFWLTDEAAKGELIVKKISQNKFKAVLTAETKGTIGFFANYRKDIMISEMIYDKKYKRFIPKKFIKRIIIGENHKESVYIFDYKNMRIIKKRKKVTVIHKENSPEQDFLNNIDDNEYPKKIVKTSSYTIPLKNRNIDDYLSASVNFFMGVYGIPSPKNIIKIRLFPEKKKKKRNRIITVISTQLKNGFQKLTVKLNVDFISDKVKKAFVKINGNMIPVSVEIPTGTLIGTIHAERIGNEKKQIHSN